MPYRNTPLVVDQYYHVFNRGVNKVNLFDNKYDYNRFIKIINYYQLKGPKPSYSMFSARKKAVPTNQKIVDIVCYCLMPNHYHFIIKPNTENALTEFMRKVNDSYAKYKNIKYSRVGPLYQVQFRAVLIENNEYLLHLSRYIHLNPIIGKLASDVSDYLWSSYGDYLSIASPLISCTKEIILNQFKDADDYQKFLQDQVGYAIELDFIKHHLLDSE